MSINSIPTEVIVVSWRLSRGRLPLTDRHLKALTERGVGSALHAWLKSRLEWSLVNDTIGFADGVLRMTIDPQGDVNIAVLELPSAPESEDLALVRVDGRIEDGRNASVWVRSGQKVATPTVPSATPRGTRTFVRDLATTLGYTFEERVISEEELESADEAFLVHDVFGVIELDARGGELVERLEGCFAKLWNLA